MIVVSEDPIATLLHKASEVIAQASELSSKAGAKSGPVLDQLQKIGHQVDGFAQFWLLPLCLALLILHEHYRSVADGGTFRVTHVFVRTGAVIALVLGYSKLCGVITGVAGAGSGWMTLGNSLEMIEPGYNSLGTAWDKLGGLSDLPKFVGIVIVWAILMLSLLFAYVSGALLSLVQAVTLALLLGLGKTCIVVSLVPGVDLGKSWAKALAQVAAWSTVAGVILGLLSSKNVAIVDLMTNGDFVALLKASAHFIILALLTLAVPLITAKLFSGGAAGLAEVAAGFVAARSVASRAVGMKGRDGFGSAQKPEPSSGAGGRTPNERPHKIPHGGESKANPPDPRPRPLSPRDSGKPSDLPHKPAPAKGEVVRHPDAPRSPVVDGPTLVGAVDEEAKTLT